MSTIPIRMDKSNEDETLCKLRFHFYLLTTINLRSINISILSIYKGSSVLILFIGDCRGPIYFTSRCDS